MEDTLNDSMPFMEHLTELRVRVIRIFIALLICCGISYYFRKEILDLIKAPVDIPLQKYTNIEDVAPVPEVIPELINCECTPKTISPKKIQVQSKIQKSSKIELSLSCICQNPEYTPAPPKIEKKRSSMVFIGIPEVFFSQMKVAFFTGLFLAFPFIIIEIWGFIGPALYKGEKKVFWVFALATNVCFTGGALFGYFVVFPFGFDFFLSLTQIGEIMPSLSIGEYLSFTLKLLFAFGFTFEMPLVVFILSRLGVVTPQMMIKYFRYAILFFFVFAAFLTPPDPFTMLLMAGPLILLYIISIAVSYLGVDYKKAALKKQGYEESDL